MNSANDSQIHKTLCGKSDTPKPNTCWNFGRLSKADAQKILNSLKDGDILPTRMIDYALMMTGDLKKSAWRKRQILDRDSNP